MTTRSRFSAVRNLVATMGVLALVGCGGNRPAQQQEASQPPAQAETSGSTPAPSTPADTAANAPAPIPPAPIPTSPRPTAPSPKPTSKPPASKPTPAPAPPPAPVVKTLFAGTELAAELVDPASSKSSKIGDVVRARVTQAVMLDGVTVVPEGAVIAGTVTEAIPLKKIGGQAILGLKFNTLEIAGDSTPIVASLLNKGKSETGKDAGTIAGATAGGALLGRLLSKHDKTKGTLIGAAVGAAAGTGAAAATKGQEVELPAGTPFSLHLDEAAQVTVHH